MTEPPQPLHSSRFAEARPGTVRIIDETPDWLVVDKAPHVQVHPSKPGDTRTLWDDLRGLLAYELACGGQVSIINRLDRETSGLTLVAKNRAAARWLCQQMELRRIRKSYLAIVFGWPAQDRWRVEAPILRQGEKQPSAIWLKQMVHPEGAPCQTTFEVERRFTLPPETSPDAAAESAMSAPERKFAIVRARPETGRMHQIRVHLAWSGYPLVGDKIYGPDERCYLEFIETGWTESLQERLLLRRHALHAAWLELEETGHQWHASLPPDLATFANGGKYPVSQEPGDARDE